MKSGTYFFGSVYALAAAAVVAFAQPATAQQPYKIGAMLDVTGGASFLGKPEHNAVILAVEEANQAGGIRGSKIELIFEDTKSTETDTVLAARKLINQAKVLALVGPSRTGGAMAAIPIVTEAEVALLSPGVRCWRDSANRGAQMGIPSGSRRRSVCRQGA